MSEDEDAKLILQRRAKFVAAALAGMVGIGVGCESEPQPCLSPPYEGGYGGAGGAGGAGGQGGSGGEPQPCLTAPLGGGGEGGTGG